MRRASGSAWALLLRGSARSGHLTAPPVPATTAAGRSGACRDRSARATLARETSADRAEPIPSARPAADDLAIEPFLHFGDDRIYNTLTDRHVASDRGCG
jgi:hypothetical protein